MRRFISDLAGTLKSSLERGLRSRWSRPADVQAGELKIATTDSFISSRIYSDQPQIILISQLSLQQAWHFEGDKRSYELLLFDAEARRFFHSNEVAQCDLGLCFDGHRLEFARSELRQLHGIQSYIIDICFRDRITGACFHILVSRECEGSNEQLEELEWAAILDLERSGKAWFTYGSWRKRDQRSWLQLACPIDVDSAEGHFGSFVMSSPWQGFRSRNQIECVNSYAYDAGHYCGGTFRFKGVAIWQKKRRAFNIVGDEQHSLHAGLLAGHA